MDPGTISGTILNLNSSAIILVKKKPSQGFLLSKGPGYIMVEFGVTNATDWLNMNFTAARSCVQQAKAAASISTRIKVRCFL